MAIMCVVLLFHLNPQIQEMVDSVSSDSVLQNVQRLQDFVTRHPTHDSCFAAAEWIYNKFDSYGLDSVYHDTFSFMYVVPANIVGIKRGIVYPESCYNVICGHFDSHTGTVHEDSAPGADDNASGVAAVLEAARILKDYQFEYDIRFIAFSAEELYLAGSGMYAWRANQEGDDIQAVFNYDMIGYVDSEPESLEVCGDTFCTPLISRFIACADTYTTLLTSPREGVGVSDESSFSVYGYPAIGLIEDIPNNNPYLHTQADTIGAGFNSISFCTNVIKAAVAALASCSSPVGVSERSDLIAYSEIQIRISPNPFSSKANICIMSGEDIMDNTLRIYDISGRVVRSLMLHNADQGTPMYTDWNGRDDAGRQVPNGVYFLRIMTANRKQVVKKAILMR
ncbi:MAG: M20/M25/M40 family metallo-hydrolase [candidate division WOR-3 bacterium]|nr:MAG: M20/M25/M40 family metallo-hydrolase [candidate division WOR-3 bacterium]